MAARKRTDDEILRDRAETATRYLHGETYLQIAQALTARPGNDYAITWEQIKYDMDVVRDEWRDTAKRGAADWIAEQLQKIDQLELNAWRAWDATGQMQTVKTQYARADDKGNPKPTAAVAQTRQGHGDARYLQTVQWCISERCKLLGLYQPETRNVNLRTPGAARVEQYNSDDLRDEIAKLQQVAALQQRALVASDPDIIDMEE